MVSPREEEIEVDLNYDLLSPPRQYLEADHHAGTVEQGGSREEDLDKTKRRSRGQSRSQHREVEESFGPEHLWRLSQQVVVDLNLNGGCHHGCLAWQFRRPIDDHFYVYLMS